MSNDTKYVPNTNPSSIVGSITDREIRNFYTKISFNEDNWCWEFTGHIDRYGYGNFGTKFGRKAHRFSFQLHNGDLVNGLSIDHLCNNKKCCNPEHLDQVSITENLKRASHQISTINSQKTHCIRNHSLTGYNLISYNTKEGKKRMCRTCKNMTSRISRKILRAKRKLGVM